MHNSALKNAGYLLSLLPQILLVVGVYLKFPWLSVIFFFIGMPILRQLIGNGKSAIAKSPSPYLRSYLAAVPRLTCIAWTLVLPWTIWSLATLPMTGLQCVGLSLSLWIVCSINTAVAHELIHSTHPGDHLLGQLLDASVGYIHFYEEHLIHHARTGHYHGGDAAKPGTSIYRYAFCRYTTSVCTAWQYESSRLRRKQLPWRSNRLLRKALMPITIALLSYQVAGILGLGIYIMQIAGAAFSIQAITYIQHWGLSEKETPTLAEYGFSWEDGCWLQACVTLNHAYHGQHHLDLHVPYHQLAFSKDGLHLPASYPMVLILALFPPLFKTVMEKRLTAWLNSRDTADPTQPHNGCVTSIYYLVKQPRQSKNTCADQTNSGSEISQ